MVNRSPFGMMINITEQHNHRVALIKARDLLEQRVKERTAELEITMLKVNIVNKAKSEFISKMSHEFYTPLNAILGFAQLLLMDELSFERLGHAVGVIDGTGIGLSLSKN